VFTSNYFEKRVINLWAIEPRDIASIPQWSNYRSLNEDRLSSLTRAQQSEKPRNLQKEMTFAYLNLSRMVNPALSINLIQDQIQKDSKNESLHNLLALAYLDQENLPAAKVIWLSQLSRNVKNPEILNNLGVLYFLQGNESLANSYFLQAATSDDGIKEAHNNLGFISLKYRNGFEARKHFEKSLKINDEDNSAKVGLSVAQVQTRDLDYAKENLDKQLNNYSNDPYAKLASNFVNNAVNKEVPELKEDNAIENSRALANDGEAVPNLE
jgi:Flp pilus assembly protein TadD